jgi:hypothetical protein
MHMTEGDGRGPVRAETRNNTNAAPSRPYHHGLGIERNASVVMVKLTCENEYAAIELYERLVVSAKNGNFKLELQATGQKQS